MAPQFADEKVLLFCSEKCKREYLKMKLKRIRTEYPRYYEGSVLRKVDTGGFEMREKLGKSEKG
ncbi:MAG: hypothetical protein U9Q73_01430 [Nanoarchaeota archaeon]|nr:hypothetical protein [Nanoarchaeota archaeon]